MSDYDQDLRSELTSLVRHLKTAIEWRQRGGAYAASGRSIERLRGSELAAESVPACHSVLAQAGVSASERERNGTKQRSLASIRGELGDCRRCRLAETRQQIVFGTGSEVASLMFIGEAPGAQEDRRGEPFVGHAGRLLDKMIRAMGWTRDTVYITNIIKCRPPGNRDPKPDEIAQCEGFVAQQIDTVAPQVIVTLGKPAAHLLLKTKAPISALRGRFQDYRGFPVMPTFHPAFLLRRPERKSETWADLKQVIAELSRLGVTPPNPPRA